MTTSDTNLNNLIINKLTKAQYESILTPSPTELYMVTDEPIDSETMDNITELINEKADYFEADSPLVESWDNLGIDFVESVGEIDSASILSSNTGDGWCNGELPEMQSTNLINDYWEWSGMFRSASVSSGTETIAIDGVNDNGFVFHIQSNGNITNPDDNNKVLANVYFNDWVRFTIIHQAGDTYITTIFDNAQGGTTTTTTTLATTSPQSINNVCWRLNVSPKIDYIVGTECYFRTEAGGIKYFFTKRHIGVDNEAFDGQWVSVNVDIGASNTSLNGSTELPYTLSTIPNDGYKYEAMISIWGTTGGANGNSIEIQVRSDELSNWINVNRGVTRASSVITMSGNVILPLSTSRKIYIRRKTDWNGTFTAQLKGYRRIGTNS